MQIGIYFNQARCTGCFACIVACKDWHDIPAGQVNLAQVKTLEEGAYPCIVVSNLFISCFHCETPPCAGACPVDAVNKRDKNGIVVVNREVCAGRDNCGSPCLDACPYDAPQFGSGDNPRMQKCDLCLERLEEHKNPVCVDACPVRALDVGPIGELAEKYGAVKGARGFNVSIKAGPSVVFKSR